MVNLDSSGLQESAKTVYNFEWYAEQKMLRTTALELKTATTNASEEIWIMSVLTELGWMEIHKTI